jgi:hypothetical protein
MDLDFGGFLLKEWQHEEAAVRPLSPSHRFYQVHEALVRYSGVNSGVNWRNLASR